MTCRRPLCIDGAMFMYTPPRQKASQYKAALANAFCNIKAYQKFSSAGTVGSNVLQLQVSGINGPLHLPLENEQADALEAICSKAVQEGMPLQLLPDAFTILNEEVWQSTLRGVVSDVVSGLGLGCPADSVEAELGRLLYYEPGSFRLPKHCLQAPDTVATLLILLPSKHSGGQLTIKHAGSVDTYGRSQLPPRNTNYVAFYSDCEHDIKKVTAGHRVCLVYKLRLRQQQPGATTAQMPAAQSEPALLQAAASELAATGTAAADVNSPAALAASRNAFIVRPGSPLVENIFPSPSPGRRPRRIAVRGRVGSPTPVPTAADAPAPAATVVAGTTPPRPAAPGPTASPRPAAVRGLFAAPTRTAAPAAPGPVHAAQASPGLKGTAAAAIAAAGQAGVASRVLPADVVAAVAAIAGGLKDWVWHGHWLKPGHLYLLLEDTYDLEHLKLGAAGLTGTDAVRVQAAAAAAAEAGVDLALVTLKRGQLLRRSFNNEFADFPPPDLPVYDDMLAGGEASAEHVQWLKAEAAAAAARQRAIVRTTIEDVVTATNWVGLDGRLFQESQILNEDELLLLDPDRDTALWRPDRIIERSADGGIPHGEYDTEYYSCTALAMWPKPIHDHPDWGSDHEHEVPEQQQQQEQPCDSPTVAAKRPAEHMVGPEVPGSAAKRLKSPYQLHKSPERTPEYYGRPYGFGP